MAKTLIFGCQSLALLDRSAYDERRNYKSPLSPLPGGSGAIRISRVDSFLGGDAIDFCFLGSFA
jgi:hypothetical protein